jgi:hypothetical protein
MNLVVRHGIYLFENLDLEGVSQEKVYEFPFSWPDMLDLDDRGRHHPWMHLTQCSVDLDVAVVTPRSESDKLVGAEQAAETTLVSAARRR